LEVRVKVYNINRGRNEAIIRRSETLAGYSAFIAKVRECEARLAGKSKPQGLTDDEKQGAMKEAIMWCIAHNILKSFLEAHGSEVVNMLMTEWKLEDALVVEREEGREERAFEIARNALAEGLPMEIIQKITGLHLDDIKSLSPASE
jgi:hypothetical protein